MPLLLVSKNGVHFTTSISGQRGGVTQTQSEVRATSLFQLGDLLVLLAVPLQVKILRQAEYNTTDVDSCVTRCKGARAPMCRA